MTLKDTATAYALAKAIVDSLKPHLDAMRADTRAAVAQAAADLGVRQLAVKDPSGATAATISVTEPRDRIGPLDEAALVEWVRDRDPDAVRTVEQVDPAYLTALLARLVIDGGDVVDPASGETIPWACVVPAGEPGITVRYANASRDGSVPDGRTLLVRAWRDGRLDLAAGGLAALQPGNGGAP